MIDHYGIMKLPLKICICNKINTIQNMFGKGNLWKQYIMEGNRTV